MCLLARPVSRVGLCDEWVVGQQRVGRVGVAAAAVNRLSNDEAVERLLLCLAVDRWVWAVAAGRPYRRLDDLFETVRDAAFPFTGAELEAALATVHPVDVVPLAREFESRAQTQLREQLADGVMQYQRRFGRPFVIRRDGRSDR